MKAFRTNIRTGERREVEIDFKIFVADDDKKIFQIIGGPTGYEAYRVNEYFLRTIMNSHDGRMFTACFGGSGYDKIEIPVSEMKKALEIELKEIMNQ